MMAAAPSDNNAEPATTIVNINIGVFGHVNSGKTSLVRALSRTLSSAAAHVSVSKERGMTIELGYSSFAVQPPASVKPYCDKLQYTLVDCPGHASLIKTILCGAQLIDRLLLVIDVTKGIQMQTAECLVLGEILLPSPQHDALIVLNKIDLLLPVSTRAEQIASAERELRSVLAGTPFAHSAMIPVAACVDGNAGDENPTRALGGAPLSTHNLVDLVRAIRDTPSPLLPVRMRLNAPLQFWADKCLPIKGQGTGLAGTVMAGRVRVGDEIELPLLAGVGGVGGGGVRKVKAIQGITGAGAAVQGDRCTLVVSQLDHRKVEDEQHEPCFYVCQPGSMLRWRRRRCRVIALVRKVRYFAHECVSGSRIYCTLGPATLACRVSFFGSHELAPHAKRLVGQRLPSHAVGFSSLNEEYEFDLELKTGGKLAGGPVLQFTLLEFDDPVLLPAAASALEEQQQLVIGSRLDLGGGGGGEATCRIAFYGRVCHVVEDEEEEVKLFTYRERRGVVDRVVSSGDREVIGRGMFGRDEDLSPFMGLPVTISRGGAAADEEIQGVIESSFGKTGKFKVAIHGGGGVGAAAARVGDAIVLRLKQPVSI